MEVSPSGELTDDLTRAFQADGTIELVKVRLSSTLKAAVKARLDGKAAIKGTFEILYFKGFELKQVEKSK